MICPYSQVYTFDRTHKYMHILKKRHILFIYSFFFSSFRFSLKSHTLSLIYDNNIASEYKQRAFI
mgnify:FL=1